jgi:hypothetical protein
MIRPLQYAPRTTACGSVSELRVSLVLRTLLLMMCKGI